MMPRVSFQIRQGRERESGHFPVPPGKQKIAVECPLSGLTRCWLYLLGDSV